MLRLLSEPGDLALQYYDTDKGAVKTVVNTDSLQRACYEHRKTDGFSPDRKWRRVAHIELNTVKLLAKMGDTDAYEYLHFDSVKARDRMIRRHPEYFKACSGGF